MLNLFFISELMFILVPIVIVCIVIFQIFQMKTRFNGNGFKPSSKTNTAVIAEIKKDFPDFNYNLAKSNVIGEVKMHYAYLYNFRIISVAISDYKQSEDGADVIFKVVYQYYQDHSPVYTESKVTYSLSAFSGPTHCSACGAAIKTRNAKVCEYCDSPVSGNFSSDWHVTVIE